MSLRRAAGWLLALQLACAGCASWSTLTERPEHYRLYRSARLAPSLEERLTAADRYLREAKDGPHQAQLASWFEREERAYFRKAFDNLPRLRAYLAALPQGPHAPEVAERIAQLRAKRERARSARSQADQRFVGVQERLAAAAESRRAFLETFRAWGERLSNLRSFGEPTSELHDETIFAFRLSAPRGACAGDACRKLLELEFQVPEDGELLARVALLEVQFELERGLLRKARLAGPELWTRIGEALSLRALPKPTPAERQDALNRSALLVRALLEPRLPAAECDVQPGEGAVLERACRGLRARMLAAPDPSQDDALEIFPDAH